MRQLTRFFLLLALLSPVFSSQSFAAGPEQTVRSMLQELQAERDPAVVLQFVHWQKAFVRLPLEERRDLDVSSAPELERYFRDFLRDPERMLHEQMLRRINQLPMEERKRAHEQLVPLVEALKRKQADLKERIGRTSYEIGQVENSGDFATVEVHAELDGKKKIRRLPLEKVGADWYLASIPFVNESRTPG